MKTGGAKPKAMYGKEIMQKGGSVDGPMEARRKIMGEKKPSLKKTLNYVKKHGSGLILKDKSKLQDSIYKPTMQKGGSIAKKTASAEDALVKRYPNYMGKDTAYDNAKKDVKSAVKGAKTGVKTVVKALPSYQAAKGTDDFLEKRYPNYFGKGTMYSKVKKGIKSVFQNGGSTSSNTTPVKKVPAKTKPAPKKVVPASSGNMKTFRLMNGYDSKGGKVESMKKGGMIKKK